MDELVIDDKKYVSTKHAAKLTGYAKDYVGQLCREGRVPARLVGRSWYVLESAIQDHRFGAPQEPGAGAIAQEEKEPRLTRTWESPRYESAGVQALPPVARQDEKANEYEVKSDRDADEASPEAESAAQEALHSSNELESAWRDWFAQTTEGNAPTVEEEPPQGVQEEAVTEPSQEQESSLQDEGAQEDGAVVVPIHSIYPIESPVAESVSHADLDITPYTPVQASMRRDDLETYMRPASQHKRSTRGMWAIQSVAAVIAIVLASSALLSSGLMDKIAISVSQVHLIAGVSDYNK